MKDALATRADWNGVPADSDPARLLAARGWCRPTLDASDAVARTTLRELFEHDLAQDEWLPAGHGYRRRAYQCFAVDWSSLGLELIPEPPPYVQAPDINKVAGGLSRTFRGIPDSHDATTVVRALALFVLRLISDSGIVTTGGSNYILDVHFIRTSAPGKPCPEGIHRDGLVAGSVHLVDLANARGGSTRFFTPVGTELGSLRLTNFLDSVVFDDARVLHYTDDIAPNSAEGHGHRDVLLFGLRESS